MFKLDSIIRLVVEWIKSATETVDSGSISGPVKLKTIKLVSTTCLLDVQYSKIQCEAFTVCGRHVAAWLESRTVPESFPC